jgi:ADP-heptose:LPS heptosyltransferase
MAGTIKYIVRKRALGDVLWIEPIIRQLVTFNRKVIVHTKYNQLFENYPYKNVIFKQNLSFWEKVLVQFGRVSFLKKWLINLDNSYEKRPKQPLLHSYQVASGLPIKDEYPKLYLSDTEKALFNSLKKSGNYAVLHVENRALKNFRKVYGINWSQIVELLNEQGTQVFTIGSDNPNIIGTTYIKTSIREMIALIYQAELFLGVDSGPSHIAASLKIPSILFFGAVNPNFRHFTSIFNGIILQQPCIYAGCFHDYKMPDDVICKIVGDEGNPPCCTFTTNTVVSAIENLLKRT